MNGESLPGVTPGTIVRVVRVGLQPCAGYPATTTGRPGGLIVSPHPPQRTAATGLLLARGGTPSGVERRMNQPDATTRRARPPAAPRAAPTVPSRTILTCRLDPSATKNPSPVDTRCGTLRIHGVGL